MFSVDERERETFAGWMGGRDGNTIVVEATPRSGEGWRLVLIFTVGEAVMSTCPLGKGGGMEGESQRF